MKHKEGTITWIFVAFAVVSLMLVVALVCWVGLAPYVIPEKEIDGFDEELLDLIERRYGLVVPEEAMFVGGYFNQSLFGDYYVFVAFDLDLKDYIGDGYAEPESDEELNALICETVMSFSLPENAFAETSERYDTNMETSFYKELCEKFNREYIGQYSHSDQAQNPWTKLLVSDVKDGVISFCLIGDK